jgi:hypothetical protein
MGNQMENGQNKCEASTKDESTTRHYYRTQIVWNTATTETRGMDRPHGISQERLDSTSPNPNVALNRDNFSDTPEVCVSNLSKYPWSELKLILDTPTRHPIHDSCKKVLKIEVNADDEYWVVEDHPQ